MATISINDLNDEPTFDVADVVKGGKGNQEVYLTYKLENTLVSSYS